MKRLTVTQQRMKQLKTMQKRALTEIKKLEKKGYVVTNKAIKEALSTENIRSKRHFETLKNTLLVQNIHRQAEYMVRKYHKINAKDYYDQMDESMTLAVPIYGKNEAGKDVVVDYDYTAKVGSGIEMKLMEKYRKHMNEGNTYEAGKVLAEIVNKLLGSQMEHYSTADTQLLDAVWDLKKSGAEYTNDQTIKYGNWTDYKETGDEDTDKENFYRTVRFKNINPSNFNYIEAEIIGHPQTSEELHDYYLENAANKSYMTNKKNLMQYQADKLNVPVEVVTILTDLMETSEIWHIAAKGTWDSDQVLDNWEHIYQDMLNLEGVKATSEVRSMIDSLRRDITNGGDDLTVNKIKERVEEIMEKAQETYKNEMSMYYDEEETKKWMETPGHVDKKGNIVRRRGGSKYRR